MTDAEQTFFRSKKTCLILNYLRKPALAAAIVSLVDSLGLMISFGFVSRDTLVLLLLLEGGIGLMSGVGIALSSTPSISKIGHATIGTAEWSREAEKNAERVGLKWIVTGSFLVIIGFALSVV